eukprot:augustus_masked-scaffold_19-processed-gene-5.51-mRNA-1 protein AED:1.00 eAED:1.00 QI:0/-1/0/0/-1/1/1/0/238
MKSSIRLRRLLANLTTASSVSPEKHSNQFFTSLQSYFVQNSSLPGENSHAPVLPSDAAKRLGASEVRRRNLPFRESAVMIILNNLDDEVFITLEKRRSYSGHHSGQVCLPGGSFDEEDINLQVTAERETFEELGIPTSLLNVIGSLTEVYIPVSGFIVAPYVAIFNGEDLSGMLDPHPREVENVISLSVEDLLMCELKKVEVLGSFKAPAFVVNDEIIWGATAAILQEFKEVVQTVVE